MPRFFLQENHGMAWWTHVLFFGKLSEDHKNHETARNGSMLAVFRRAVEDYLYNHLIDFLFISLSVFAYLYLLLAIVAFFFENQAPRYLPDIIETLAEPYLGAIGIYIVIKEIERRRGKNVKGLRKSDFFTLIWFIFLVTASFLIYFSENYHWDSLYKTIVTNALAALIIRIGAFIK